MPYMPKWITIILNQTESGMRSHSGSLYMTLGFKCLVTFGRHSLGLTWPTNTFLAPSISVYVCHVTSVQHDLISHSVRVGQHGSHVTSVNMWLYFSLMFLESLLPLLFWSLSSLREWLCSSVCTKMFWLAKLISSDPIGSQEPDVHW